MAVTSPPPPGREDGDLADATSAESRGNGLENDGVESCERKGGVGGAVVWRRGSWA